MHELTLYFACVMMLVAPALVTFSGRLHDDKDLE
jgi:hypothetical protein